ncbi:MAG: Xaa-Pro peptidase family protein [Armatimonadota bacterium]|nr:Xaa-Pro peptidase family protein [Armatimonadota bacterium]
MSDRAAELSPAFHARRRAAAIEAMQRAGFDALVVANAPTIAYLTGFFHLTTERPILVVLPASGDVFAITTALEADHLAARCPWLTDLVTYFDYPEADWSWAATRLRDRGLAGRRIGVDLANLVMSDPVGAYEALRSALGDGVRNATPLLQQVRMVKDAEEIAIFRTACAFSDWHVGQAFGVLREGVTEYEVHEAACRATIERMLRELPRIEDQNGYDRNVIHGRTLFAGGSALPHGPKGTRRLAAPSVVIASYGVGVCHYLGETERTGFFGAPPLETRRVFDVMLAAQSAALDAIRPGATCSQVHAAATRVIREAGLAHGLRHHTGHGKGIESHEPPFFDAGDHTELVPGMVMSVEPGIYLPGVAGFRHSDTVLVTETGCEVLTRFPRDASGLTFPA